MLLSIQRVRDATGQEAIHVYCYRHDISADLSTADRAFKAPVRFVRRVSSTVPPGGNRVLSYVDAIAPEGSSTSSFMSALDALRSLATAPPRQLPIRIGSWWLRYDMDAARHRRWRDELADLRSAYWTEFS